MPAGSVPPGGVVTDTRETDGLDEAFDAASQQAKLDVILSAATGTERLEGNLRDRDPVIAAAAFQALTGRSYHAAVQALLNVINDTTEPVRLQALQTLLNAPGIENATIVGALRSALRDPDPAFVACAVQALTIRSDPDAVSVITEALREGSVATRLAIVRSAGNSDAAQGYLYYALRDPDAKVRSAAMDTLSPSKNEVSIEQ
jgi:HEAT repeat protein